jgi:tetratricopeptide (TPR) repeat protein
MEKDDLRKIDSTSADGYYNKFLTLLGTRRIDEAKVCACKAVELNNTFYTAAILAAAQNSLTDENYDVAIILLDLLIELGFNTHDMWRSKAKALTMKRRFEEALSCFDKAIEIKSHDHETLTERGLLFETLGRYEDAIASLEKAAVINPKNTRTLQIIGNIHVKLRKFQEGIKYYDTVIEMDSENIVAYKRKSWALFNLGKYSEGLECLERFLASNPDDQQFWSFRGVILDALERYE